MAEPSPAPTTATPVASTSKAAQKPAGPRLPRTVIREGDNVLIRLPSTIIKPIKINSNQSVNLGKYGSFKAKELVGRPYGHTYEITEGGLAVVETTLTEIEETEANNEYIKASGAQNLTFEDIQALKNEGITGREMIQRQVNEHAAFELKTEYSKEKYMKRKEAKYLQMFTVVEPTVYEVCLHNFEKQQSKIRDLRPDTLAQMMAMANVRPGGKLLVVEDLHGMVVAAAVDRMGGDGRILVINDFDSPPDLHLCDTFNFSPEDLAPISTIHWAATEESYTPPDLPLEIDEATAKAKNSRDVVKLKKRKATYDKAQNARNEFFDGGFDGVIIATEYEPYSILERLLPAIGGSASIVIYSPYVQILYDCHSKMRAQPDYLAPSIMEPWLRNYQVLPGRCHPQMNGMAHGGFLLTATRVFDDATAQSVMMGRKKRRVEKREREAKKGSGEAEAEAEAEAGADVAVVAE